LGDPSMTAHVLSYLARTLQCLGEYRDAERLLRESLQLSQENGYRFATGLSLDGLGKIAYAEGRCEEAQRYFAESAGVFRDLGDKHRLSRTLNHQGLNRLALHQASEAQEDFGTALRLAYEGHFTPAALNALAGLAALAVHQEAGEETLELVLYILEHPASSQETRDLAARLKEELGAGLTPAEMDRVHRLAGAKTLDDFVRPVLTGVHAG
ncbi:MAG: tetratricopeptide repeat protein, partial [Bacteroidota bacterium]